MRTRLRRGSPGSVLALLVAVAGCAVGVGLPAQDDTRPLDAAALDRGPGNDAAADDTGTDDLPRDAPAGALDGAAGTADTSGSPDGAVPQDAAGPVDATQADGAGGLTGDTCETAQPVTPGTLTGQTTIAYTADYTLAATCVGYGTRGRDRVYSITVAAGQTLTVLVHPLTSAWDPQVYLFEGPATACSSSAICLAGADSAYSGEDETLTWTNTGTSRLVFIVVDYYLTSDSGGDYDLSVTLS